MMTIRERFGTALSGRPVGQPVYAVYDWFVKNRPIDWASLFGQGLGQIAHASLLEYEYSNLEIVETVSHQDGQPRRDVRWITDRGELNEWYLGEWRQAHLVKSPADYRILARALEGGSFRLSDTLFGDTEAGVADLGITIGQLGPTAMESRTPLQAIQIDCAGLERFSIDLAMQCPELLDLIEQMNDRTLDKFRLVRESRAVDIKLWENLSIETMGPAVYRTQLVPLYRKIFNILSGSGKRLQVHYDGNLRSIAPDIRELGFDGLDSLTGPPEGDLSAAEARTIWPDTFLWLHPNLGWYERPASELRERIRAVVRGAGPSRFCLMISEEVPPHWQASVPVVLQTLEELGAECA